MHASRDITPPPPRPAHAYAHAQTQRIAAEFANIDAIELRSELVDVHQKQPIADLELLGKVICLYAQLQHGPLAAASTVRPIL